MNGRNLCLIFKIDFHQCFPFLMLTHQHQKEPWFGKQGFQKACNDLKQRIVLKHHSCLPTNPYNAKIPIISIWIQTVQNSSPMAFPMSPFVCSEELGETSNKRKNKVVACAESNVSNQAEQINISRKWKKDSYRTGGSAEPSQCRCGTPYFLVESAHSLSTCDGSQAELSASKF